MPGSVFGIDDDGFHVLAEQLGDGDIVARVNRVAHVDDAVKHAPVEPLEVLYNLLLLLAARVFVLVDAGFAQVFGNLVQFSLASTGEEEFVQVQEKVLYLIQG